MRRPVVRPPHVFEANFSPAAGPQQVTNFGRGGSLNSVQ